MLFRSEEPVKVLETAGFRCSSCGAAMAPSAAVLAEDQKVYMVGTCKCGEVVPFCVETLFIVLYEAHKTPKEQVN